MGTFSHVEIVIEPKRETSCSDLSSSSPSSCDYTAVTPRPNHQWTIEQEGVLCVLKRWYANDPNDIAKIFNSHFNAEGQGSGLGKKMNGHALSSKLHTMRNLREESRAYTLVFIETLFADEFGSWQNTREDLEKTAQILGIIPIRKTYEHRENVLWRWITSPKKRKKISEDDGVLGYVACNSEQDDDPPKTPMTKRKYLPTPSPSPLRVAQTSTATLHKRQCVRSIKPTKLFKPKSSAEPVENHRAIEAQGPLTADHKNHPPQVKGPSNNISCHSFGHLSSWVPKARLVFRFYDDNSSGLNTSTRIRAGAFLNETERIPQSADWNGADFWDAARRHLTRVREPTPFISVYESPLPVLHRGLRSSANGSVAVVDLHEVSKTRSSGIYSAAQLINQLGLVRGSYRYRGTSEWLIWGEIESKAIGTTFSIQQLRRFLAGAPDVSIVLQLPAIERSKNANEYRKNLAGNLNGVGEASGRVVGKFLAFTGLPKPSVDDVALKITRAWQLPGRTSLSRQRRYLEGVHYGLTQTEACLGSSEVPMESDEFLARRRHIDVVCFGT